MRTLFAVLPVFLLALPLAAADVDGKWEASTQGQKLSFQFQADGPSLTGTVSFNSERGTPIRRGSIEGDQISFLIGRGKMNFIYTGTVSSGEIAFKRGVEGDPQGRTESFTATRPK